MNGRREFFRRASQLMLLSGLIGGSAYLVARNGVSENCSNSDLCNNCNKLQNCDLKKADNFKRKEK